MYDLNGNLVTMTPPAPMGQTQIVVDSLSRTTSITDGKGQKTTFGYDGLDRIVQILFNGATTCASSTTCTTLQWDTNGNLVSRTDATGTTTFSYDKLNRLTKKTLPASTSYCTGQGGITTAYDSVGNLIQYCDSGGAVTFNYDSLNRITYLAEPGGSCSGTVSLCTTYSYDSDSRLVSLRYPGGATQSWTYDNAGHVTSIAGKASTGTVITSFVYSYTQGLTDVNAIVKKTENDALFNNLVTSYAYDSHGRLTQATQSYATGCCSSWTYGYDAAGNRTSAPDGNSTFNNANEITSSPGVTSYSFDANGSLTGSSTGGSLSYNPQNQTTAMNWGGTNLTGITYAGTGQTERTAAGSTSFASGSMGLTIATTAGGSAYFLRDSVGRLIGEKWTDGNHYYYLRDLIGSVVAVINGDGSIVPGRQVYDPFGNVIQSLGLSNYSPWGFAGGYTDATGFLKFGSRYYDPKTGRFTQPEPAALTPNYSYAKSNPVNFADPSGNVVICDCGGDAPAPADWEAQGYDDPPIPSQDSSPAPTSGDIMSASYSSPSPSPAAPPSADVPRTPVMTSARLNDGRDYTAAGYAIAGAFTVVTGGELLEMSGTLLSGAESGASYAGAAFVGAVGTGVLLLGALLLMGSCSQGPLAPPR
jgi:RHS repeat-associated protein